MNGRGATSKRVLQCSVLVVDATSASSAPVTHAYIPQTPPQTSPLTAEDISRRDHKSQLVAQLRARFSSERSQSSNSAANFADIQGKCSLKGSGILWGGKNKPFCCAEEFFPPESGGAVGEAGGEVTQTQY
ncbi:hypothetical protein Tco_1092255 [Tanacetum coccineum]|uniref:Uncharacterized protein n=1 Tax=Tanacetum coccineum TaxID=301880 RepID=A0ABQ5I9B4_9ASTR